MKQGNGVGRRTFLKNVALTGGLAARDENATEQKKAREARASKSIISYPRVYSGRRLSTLAFPLGGVGTGCISLGGRGQLRDWEIYNRPTRARCRSTHLPRCGSEQQGGSRSHESWRRGSQLLTMDHAGSGI